MEPIKKESSVNIINQQTRRLSSAIKGQLSTIVSALIILVITAVFFTDTKAMGVAKLKDLTAVSIVIVLCSYAMFSVNFAKGKLVARQDSDYIKTTERYDAVTKTISDKGIVHKLQDFCTMYIKEELKATKERYLGATGISYQTYVDKYEGKSLKEIKALGTQAKKAKALDKINRIKPVKLNAQKLMSKGSDNIARDPLGKGPVYAERKSKVMKGIKTVIMSVLTIGVTLQVIANPTWATFAEYLLKCFSVVMGAFMGYKAGFETIADVSKNYLDNQSYILERFVKQEANIISENCTE